MATSGSPPRAVCGELGGSAAAPGSLGTTDLQTFAKIFSNRRFSTERLHRRHPAAQASSILHNLNKPNAPMHAGRAQSRPPGRLTMME